MRDGIGEQRPGRIEAQPVVGDRAVERGPQFVPVAHTPERRPGDAVADPGDGPVGEIADRCVGAVHHVIPA